MIYNLIIFCVFILHTDVKFVFLQDFVCFAMHTAVILRDDLPIKQNVEDRVFDIQGSCVSQVSCTKKSVGNVEELFQLKSFVWEVHAAPGM